MNVLIVDDSRAIRSLLTRLLRSQGHTTFEAGNGIEALAAIEAQGGFDLALVDWNMPEMDGLQLLQSVRARPTLASMSVMMITTESEVSRMQLALAGGANEYLMKPFTPDALFGKLALLGSRA